MCRSRIALVVGSRFLAALVLCSLVWAARPAQAQLIQLATPRTNVGHSFQENIGVNFGFNIPGARPGPGGELPNSGIVGLTPQGNVTPDGSIQFRRGQPGGFGAGQAGLGFGILGGGGGGAFFGITGGQSATSSISSTVPSVTVMNGGWGTFQDVRQQPFVTGLTPVVGGWVGGPPPVTYRSVLAERVERMYAQGGPPASPTSAYVEPEPEPAQQLSGAVGGESTAARGDVSVAEIRRQQEMADAAAAAEIDTIVADARAAEAEGNLGVAVIYYRRAARLASGELQAELQAHIDELNASRDR